MGAAIVAMHFHAPRISSSFLLFNEHYSLIMKYLCKNKLHDFSEITGLSPKRFKRGTTGQGANPFYRDPAKKKNKKKKKKKKGKGKGKKKIITNVKSKTSNFTVDSTKMEYSEQFKAWLETFDGDDTGEVLFQSLAAKIPHMRMVRARYVSEPCEKSEGASLIFREMETVGGTDFWVYLRQFFGDIFLTKNDELLCFQSTFHDSLAKNCAKPVLLALGDEANFSEESLDTSECELEDEGTPYERQNLALRDYTQKVNENINFNKGLTYRHLLENRLPFFETSISNLRKNCSVNIALRIVLLYEVKRHLDWSKGALHSLLEKSSVLGSHSGCFVDFLSLFGDDWLHSLRTLLFPTTNKSDQIEAWNRCLKRLVKSPGQFLDSQN